MITAKEARALMPKVLQEKEEKKCLKRAESLIRHFASKGYVNCYMDWEKTTSDNVKRNVIQKLKDNGYTVKELNPVGKVAYGGIAIFWYYGEEE